VPPYGLVILGSIFKNDRDRKGSDIASGGIIRKDGNKMSSKMSSKYFIRV